MIVRYRALASRVLVVASINDQVGDWAAYIDAVPGHHHDREYMEVKNTGNKLDQKIAEILFPDEAKMYRWRP